MGIPTADEYRQRISKLKPKLYMAGKRVENLMDNPIVRGVIEACARAHELTLDPEYEDILTATSSLTGNKVHRSLRLYHSIEDILKGLEVARVMSQKLGVCTCLGSPQQIFTPLAATLWEMDSERGTTYYQRFIEWIKFIENEGLIMSGGFTDVKGDRSKRPLEQDPDSYLHIVEKTTDGIVVKGAKQHQSTAFISDETLIIPSLNCRKGEEDYAVAFAVSNGTDGMTYISQYTPFSAEREHEENIWYLGNPYGQRETCLLVFDNVFIPWERVFMCGEIEYTGKALARFAKQHRMWGGGPCKAGWMDLIIGATALLAEYNGADKYPSVIDKITEMITISETAYSCAIAAACKAKEEPPGSGLWLPDMLLGNISKIAGAKGFWRVIELAGDIAGGIVVTMPHERELINDEIKQYIEKYMKAAAPADKRMRIAKFLQNWVAGQHGVGTWQGGGPPDMGNVYVRRAANLEEKKKMAKDLAGIVDD